MFVYAVRFFLGKNHLFGFQVLEFMYLQKSNKQKLVYSYTVHIQNVYKNKRYTNGILSKIIFP